MLFPIIPVTFVFLAVWPHIHAPPVLLVILIVSVITTPIRPRINTLVMKLVFTPLTLVFASIRPKVDSEAFNLVVSPLTVIISSINPLINASSVLLPSVKITLVNAPIRECFRADTLLHIDRPLAVVTLASLMHISTVPVGFVSLEETLKDVSVGVIKSALPFSLAKAPFSDILSTVHPKLGAVAVLQARLVLQLASVATAVLHDLIIDLDKHIFTISL